MIFPVGTTVFLTILIEMAFLIDGISRVVHGFGDKESRGCSRGFNIGVGMIMIVTGYDCTSLSVPILYNFAIKSIFSF